MHRTFISIAFLIGLLQLFGTAHAQEAEAKASELDKLVALARKNHPTSRAAKQRVRAAKEVPSRVSSLPDPMLITSAQNFRFDDVGLGTHPMTGLVVGVTQGLPYPGKLGARKRVANAISSLTSAHDRNLEENIELKVRRLYWNLHYSERALAIVTENLAIVDMLTNVVHVRFAVGQGAQQDAIQAQVAHSRLRVDIEARKQAVQSARRALNEAVGREPEAFLAATTKPHARLALASRDTLRTKATSHNPRLAIARTETLVASRKVARARRDRYPDFMIGANYRARASAPGDGSDGADMVSVTVGMTLPLWLGDKQDAAVREQGHRLRASQATLDAELLAVETSVELVYDEISRLDMQLKLYEGELLAAASLSVDASIGDYQVGKVGFVSVLENWRTDLNLQVTYEQLVALRAQAQAQLHTLVGADVARNAQ
tara:strand:- start:16301 stop:17596 length:1296 start_codon:yes stop_codon:yes gene_type:complete